MTSRIVVLGAGGHAKVVVSALQETGTPPEKLLDDDSSKWGTELLGVPIVGPIEALDHDGAIRAVTAIGNNRQRFKVTTSKPANWTSAIHPSARVHDSVEVSPGVVVCAGAVIQPGTRLGSHAIVNTGAIVDHDCEVGDYAHIGPGASLAGNVRIGTGSLVGIGAAVVPGVVVGDWAKIGAGAAVTGDLPADCIAVGVPARLLEVDG